VWKYFLKIVQLPGRDRWLVEDGRVAVPLGRPLADPALGRAVPVKRRSRVGTKNRRSRKFIRSQPPVQADGFHDVRLRFPRGPDHVEGPGPDAGLAGQVEGADQLVR